MTEFGKSVQQHFEFLIHEYGFVLKSGDVPVRYDSLTLYVEVWLDRTEVDLLFGVKVDTEVLRPYVSHIFRIAEIVRYYITGPFPKFASYKATPGVSEQERLVIYLAAMTKEYCAEILRGDISPLEKLSLNRGSKSV